MPYRLLATAALLVALLAPLTAAAAVPPAHAAFDARFRELLAEREVPGGAYAIVRSGRIEHIGTVGVRSVDGGEPVTAHTVFRIASVSKTFAAQLAVLLADEGRLKLDDPLSRWLPDIAFKRREHALQLSHLLGQSTGIVPNAYDNLLDANTPLERILPRFRELEPICAPGRCYTYQNILFGLIGPVLEQAGGERFDVLMSQRLFEPLQMRDASLGLDAFRAAGDRAEPHLRRNGRWQRVDPQPGYYQVAPAAGINASATDLAQWLIAQLGHRPEVIPPHTVAAMTAKGVRTAKDRSRRGWRELLTDAHYGLGWRIYSIGEHDIVLHSGWVAGFVADVSYSRSHDTGLVVLLNAETGLLGDIGAAFWGPLLRGGGDTIGTAGATIETAAH